MTGAPAASAKVAGDAATSVDGLQAKANRDDPAPAKANQAVSTANQPICTYGIISDNPDAIVSTPTGIGSLYDSTHPSTDGSWQWKACTDTSGNQVLSTVWIPKANPVALAQQAISEQSLPLPKIATSPAISTGAVVNLPTWLWINTADWHAISATAAVDGFSVTATATPVSVSWNMGNGKSVTCNGPGIAYDVTLPDAGQHSDCTYAYPQSSANQPNHAYVVTATVQWRTTWQASDGTNGQLDTINRTSTTSIPVREIQSINVAPAGGW